ncbi:MAG TPA: THUMP domain-containing protein [Candidatus Binatia bacterium]|nr:THUMP domain-containing protein [Candidatus Binatia bacterium]
MPAALGDWNVLATSLEGRRDALLIALRRLGKFRRGGYRNVVVGRVEDVPVFLAAVREALASDPLLPTALAKVVPVETVVRFDATNAVEAIVAAAEPFVPRLAGGSFFVRLERRGMKGRLHTPTVERDVGDRVWRALEARGETPRVDFRDPDAVLVVETVGDEAGVGVLSRALRTEFPFVKIR